MAGVASVACEDGRVRERVGGLPLLAVPATVDVVLLAVAVLATSSAAPLIAATAAPTLAIAFWRNALSSALLVPWAAARRRPELRALPLRGWRLSACAGGLLAAHFGTWIPSLALTSVASSTALVATQPVWAAVIARVRGDRVPLVAWVGTGLCVVGAALVAGIDLQVSTRALGGDLLALAGAAMAAGYVTVGSAVRSDSGAESIGTVRSDSGAESAVRVGVSTVSYTAICYSVCAVLLLVVNLLGGQRLGGWGSGTWLKLVALTVGAQLLGHSLVNVALRSTSATVVSLVMLLEVPGAALIAALWLHQVPGPAALPGLALLLGGAALVLRAR
ncbi:MAG TPA: DMT family transporter [Mycobacteriales bacterium]|nr:DMT family transporter [Mycobacteriales bacterium]